MAIQPTRSTISRPGINLVIKQSQEYTECQFMTYRVPIRTPEDGTQPRPTTPPRLNTVYDLEAE